MSTSTTTTTPSTNGAAQRAQVHDPVHHVSFSFEHGDGHIWVHTWFEDGGHLPEHFHPSLEEHWEVVEGTARVKLDGTWRDLRPEDGPVLVPRNMPHELKNESGSPLYAKSKVIPGGRLEEFLTEASKAGEEGLYNARNLPTSWKGAMWIAKFAYRFRDETVMCSPPPAVQRVVLPLVVRLAR
jgi:mannose-6-phosphate isomerase-like protein (cupin superfamily)